MSAEEHQLAAGVLVPSPTMALMPFDDPMLKALPDLILQRVGDEHAKQVARRNAPAPTLVPVGDDETDPAGGYSGGIAFVRARYCTQYDLTHPLKDKGHLHQMGLDYAVRCKKAKATTDEAKVLIRELMLVNLKGQFDEDMTKDKVDVLVDSIFGKDIAIDKGGFQCGEQRKRCADSCTEWQKSRCPIYKQRVADAKSDRTNPAAAIIEIAQKNGLKLFKNASKRGYASFQEGGHAEIWPIESSNFSGWLIRKCYDGGNGFIPSAEALASTIRTLNALSYDEELVTLDLRVAQYDGSIWFDLCRDDWKVVRINPSIEPNGWEIIDAPKHLFWRSISMLETPEPVPCDNANTFWSVINLPKDEGDKIVLKSNIGSFLIPDIAHALIELYGKSGCGKTESARAIKTEFDPCDDVDVTLYDVRNIHNVLEEHYIAFLNNVSDTKDKSSGFTRGVADICCKAIDGGGASERKLGTNRDQERYKYRRCIIVAGIDDVIPQYSDLGRRSNTFQQPFISGKGKVGKTELEAKFESCRAETLGYFFTIVSKAMTIYETMKSEPKIETEGLADFCLWGEAISRAMDNAPGAFTKAYDDKIISGTVASLESNDLAEAITYLMDGYEATGGWAGSHKAAFEALTAIAVERSIPTKGDQWPRKPGDINGKMARIVEDLRKNGIHYERFERASSMTAEDRKIMEKSSKESVATRSPAGKSEVQAGRPVLMFRWLGDAPTASDDAIDEGTERLLATIGAAPGKLKVEYIMGLDPGIYGRIQRAKTMGWITVDPYGFLTLNPK